MRLCGLAPQFVGVGRIRAVIDPPDPGQFRPVAPRQARPNAPFQGASGPLPARSARPAAFNADSRVRGSGLVQHVFRSPARHAGQAAAAPASCATPPSEKRDVVRPVHNKAMPVLLTEEACNTWLEADTATALALQKPWPNDRLSVVATGKQQDGRVETAAGIGGQRRQPGESHHT